MKIAEGREDFEVNEVGTVGKEVDLIESSAINDQHEQERGASLVEYALLVALIAVVGLAGIRIVGENASDKLYEVGDAIAGTDFTPCVFPNPPWPNC